MTTTLDDVTARKKPEPTPEEVAALAVVRRAREQGLSLAETVAAVAHPWK
jgi:hypothetical protein